ncbi:MAG: DNA polymerase I [Bacteroidales bacterium]|nr:DNA polymerase I [Bacteroidales bacterium]
MDRLFLIDGHSLIFRMYYAFMRRPMINSKGEDTSILFGFTKFLLELIRKEHPTHLAVAFDPPAKTFRHELDPEYKANRSAAPELVKAALEPLTEIVSALDIPVLMKPGFEADDVIGSVAKHAAARGFKVYMVTPDKDLGQIIDDNILQFKPGKSGGDDEIWDKARLCEAFGICDPAQIIDILTIWGDASDNIKGVEGVGEVGAKKLVGKYGSLDNIFAHLDELPPKQQEKFRAAEPHLALSRTLATIRTDVETGVTEEELRLTAKATPRLYELFDHYEFNSLRSLLPEGDGPVEVQAPEHKTLEPQEVPLSKITSAADASGKVAVRIEGDSVLLSVAEEFCRCTLAEAEQLLSNPFVEKVGFGLKHTALRGDLYDIEIMHYLLNPERSHKLSQLARGYLGVELENSAETGGMLFSFDDGAAPRECVAAGLIEPLLRKELEDNGIMRLYTDIEMPLIPVLADMEATGVRIDPAQLAQYGRQLSMELEAIENEARAMVEEPQLNLSSPKQVGVVIYEKLALDPKAKKNGKSGSYSTDEETLAGLPNKHPFVDKVLEYRGIKKLISTYLEPLPALMDPRDGKVHTTFNQALTATGRLSSSKPNLQNIPVRTAQGREIRKAFVPSDPDGFIVSADYSQIELRLMAVLSGDPALLEGFNNGADIHADTASRIFHTPLAEVTPEQRRQAKVANFGIIYGISAFGLAQRMGISRTESKNFIEQYFIHYPKVREYMDAAIASARDKGYVETIFGRKRYLPDISSRNQVVRSLAERNAINAPIQGSAADIIKMAMINVYKRLQERGYRSRMVLQVHDELVFDVVPEEKDSLMKMVKEEMEGVCTLPVPLTVECDYGKNWLEAH